MMIDATVYRNLQATLYLVGSLCYICGAMMYVPKDAFMPPEDNDE